MRLGQLLRLVLLLAIFSLQAFSGSSGPGSEVKKAEKSLSSGDIDSAISRLSTLVEKGEDDPSVHLTLAKALFAKSLVTMQEVKNYKFNFETTQVSPTSTQRSSLSGTRKADRALIDVNVPGGVAAQVII